LLGVQDIREVLGLNITEVELNNQ